jgi:hypothetical protein
VTGIISKFKWKRDQKIFYSSLKELKRLKDLANRELSAVNIDQDTQWRQRVLAAVTATNSLSLMTPTTTPQIASLSPSGIRFPHFLIPPRSANFVGRSAPMDLLEAGLEVKKPPHERRLRTVVIHGLGGVGKTQLAMEFAHQHRASYDACYWISADTPVKLAKGYDDIARKLQIQDVDHAQVRTLVKEWLCDTGRKIRPSDIR